MRTNTRWISKTTGEEIIGYYEDITDLSILPKNKISSIATFCYYSGKFVIVNNEGLWQPVAGHVEPGETPVQALIREVREESNMKVLRYFPVGYHFCRRGGEEMYQAHFLCLVEPIGKFISDPAREVSEIKLVNYDEISSYIVPQDVGLFMLPRCLEIIKKIEINQ